MRAFHEYGKIDPPPWLSMMEHIPYHWQAWASLGIEYFIVVALWWRRPRIAVLAIAASFQLLMDITMPISIFTFQMLLLYLLFLPIGPQRYAAAHPA